MFILFRTDSNDESFTVKTSSSLYGSFDIFSWNIFQFL